MSKSTILAQRLFERSMHKSKAPPCRHCKTETITKMARKCIAQPMTEENQTLGSLIEPSEDDKLESNAIKEEYGAQLVNVALEENILT